MESPLSQEVLISSASAMVAIISALFALIGLFFTYRKNKFDKALALDKDLYSAAETKLKSAFDALVRDGLRNGVVENEPLNWVIAAREIEKYKKFKEKISTDNYKMIVNSLEEYWSNKFYDVIGGINLIQEEYYSHLHPGSVLIVYAFSSWKEDQRCLIDSVN